MAPLVRLVLSYTRLDKELFTAAGHKEVAARAEKKQQEKKAAASKHHHSRGGGKLRSRSGRSGGGKSRSPSSSSSSKAVAGAGAAGAAGSDSAVEVFEKLDLIADDAEEEPRAQVLPGSEDASADAAVAEQGGWELEQQEDHTVASAAGGYQEIA